MLDLKTIVQKIRICRDNFEETTILVPLKLGKSNGVISTIEGKTRNIFNHSKLNEKHCQLTESEFFSMCLEFCK